MQGEMDTFNQLLLEYPQLMYGGVGATAFVAGGTLIYKIATRYGAKISCVACFVSILNLSVLAID